MPRWSTGSGCTLALMLAAPFIASTANSAELLAVRAAVHDDRSRVVLDISEQAPYKVHVQESPPSLEIIIPGTSLATEISPAVFAGTPITRAQTGTKADSGLQVAFDLSTKQATRTFALGPNQGHGNRIVIDFYPVQEETMAPPGQGDTQDAMVAARSTSGAYGTTVRSHSSAANSERSDFPVSFGGTWEQEWAVETDGARAQKFESLIEPRVDVDLPHGMQLTSIARIRLDSVGDLGPDVSKPNNYSQVNGPWYNDKNAEFSLRELYLDAQWGASFWRLGKQQVVWGQADGIKVMDVVNPQSYREFILDDFDDSRIPLWMVNVERPLGDSGNLQLLWIPDTSYHELAEQGTPYVFTSPLIVPKPPKGLPTEIIKADKPDNALDDSDAGIRYSGFFSGWDISLNYMYHYLDFPVPYQQLRIDDLGPTGILMPEYERSHLVGGTLSNVFGDFTLRAELVYNSDTYHVSTDLSERGIGKSPEVASVVGLDWQLGAYDTMLSAQWFQSHLPDYEQAITRGQSENNLSLLVRRTFVNETWLFSALALYSVDRGDRQLQLKLSYMLRGNLELWVGGDFFGGDNDGIFGQYSEEDRVLLGLELGF